MTDTTEKIYHFPQSASTGKPLIVLSYANGFLPPTYAHAFESIFEHFPVIAAHLRPMWRPVPPPQALRHWRQFGADLVETIDSISREPVVGVGHSVGAITTVYAAVQHPERFRALVLLDPTFLSVKTLRLITVVNLVGRSGRMKMVQGALKRGRHWDNLEAAYQYFRGKGLFKRWSDEAVQTYAESITTPDPQGGLTLSYPPEWEARIYQTVPTDVWQLPQKLKMPVVVIRGELTDVFTDENAAHFHRLAPHIPIVTIKQAGHLVAQEQPQAVGQAISQFLDQTLGEANQPAATPISASN